MNRRGFAYFPVVMVILIGAILATVAFAITRDLVWEKMRMDFKSHAENRYDALQQEIESNLLAIESIHAFYLSSEKVDRRAFRSFSSHLLSHQKSIQALEWIPRIPGSQRTLYETAAHQDGFPDFQITEQLEQGKMVRAGEREEYFPVFFLEPYTGNEMALGFNLFSDRIRREIMEQSRDTGKMLASPRVKRVRETGEQFGLLIFIPIYKKDAPTDSVQARRANLEGFIRSAFRIDDIVERALKVFRPEGIDITLYDQSAPEDKRFLYHHATRMEKTATRRESSKERDEAAELEFARPLFFAGREWTVVCKATPYFLSSRRTWEHWAALVIVALLTVILASYLLLSSHRTRRIEELVRERTKEIEEANVDLALAQEELTEARERLQHLISTSPAVIYSCKSSGDYGATFVSTNVISLFGYEPQEFTRGSSFWADHIHPDDISVVFSNLPRLFEEGRHSHEYRFRCKDGMYRWTRGEMILVRDQYNEPKEIVGCWVDVDEHKKAEEQIHASLREKEILLREIHHRVKNNLQIISTLLNLQLKFVRDDGAIKAFLDTQNRIEAMTLIHEKLYQSRDLARVDFAGYICDVMVNLLLLHGVDSSRISYQLDVADISLNIDTAIPLGLIINELVSNCLKHAFPFLKDVVQPAAHGNNGLHGMIYINLYPNGNDGFVLSVSDNGVGLPEGLDYRKTESLGLKLVMGLADQLDGTVELDSSQGTRFTLKFSELKYRSRG